MRACIIGAAGDPLVRRLPAALRDRDCPASVTSPERLGDLRVSLDRERFVVDGEEVTALVFRAASNAPFSASFAAEDQDFCDAETRALWLGALHVPGIRSFNRLDAVAWFEAEHWTVWRRALDRAGVPLAGCEFGFARTEGARSWVPFTANLSQPDPGDVFARSAGAARFDEQRFDRTLVACGEVVDGPGGERVSRAIELLSSRGVELAEIVTDERGAVAWVDTLPRELRADQAERLAALVADRITGRITERAS